MTSRRHFLVTAGAFSLGFAGLAAMASGFRRVAHPTARGFGPLQPDGAGLLDLPAGFSYHVFSHVGERMDDGLYVPGDHDGMAAFPGPDGTTVLVRNHELFVLEQDKSPFLPGHSGLEKIPADRLYDRGHMPDRPCVGGTTTLVYNTKNRRLVKHFLSLAGTVNNCAGGPTPWNTWITCEETTQRADETFVKDHGYNFEVPADPNGGLAAPRPILAMGRFRHEAIAVDPKTGIVYQTEDTEDGLIYRYIPEKPGDLHAGGRLQALAVEGRPGLDTRNWNYFRTVEPGERFDAAWVDLDDIDSPNNDLRHQGRSRGAALFARNEGMWYGRGVVYFAATKGGYEEVGQIWKYTPSPVEGTAGESARPGQLELFIEPNDRGLIDNADNVTVAPWGDLILCEDGADAQYLVGVMPDGRLYKLARNARSHGELAGATFSPDGTTLFVNMQREGATVAITGPWGRREA